MARRHDPARSLATAVILGPLAGGAVVLILMLGRGPSSSAEPDATPTGSSPAAATTWTATSPTTAPEASTVTVTAPQGAVDAARSEAASRLGGLVESAVAGR